MKTQVQASFRPRKGSVLVLVMIGIIVLLASGVGIMTVSYGVRRDAIKAKNEAVAMLAAEAGYERAIFRMSQQPDLLTALTNDNFPASETLTITKPDESGFEGDENELVGRVSYTISLNSFAGSRPVYKVSSIGNCGIFNRTVDVYVIQAVSGWDMGMCRIPTGTRSTSPVYYISGEVIDIPIHINSYGDPYDSSRDIYISGSPDFREVITMSESRYSTGGRIDKYDDVMNLFDDGIYFLQPSSRIMDTDAVQQKVNNFKNTLQNQKPQYIFNPVKKSSVSNATEAVQLEFFVQNGEGRVRITDNCTVRGGNAGSYDYKIDDKYSSLRFEKYDIYGYHYIPENAEANGDRVTYDVTDTYVTPVYAGIEGEPGGQIFVNGNVVIGGKKTEHSGSQVVKGRITVVATGNIWVADSVLVDGDHGASGVPTIDNPNILGLVAQGVIKVVDPGEVDNLGGPDDESGLEYEPIGIVTEETHGGSGRWVWSWRNGWQWVGGETTITYECELPVSTTIEAAITVGGGGWGAENVGDRKDNGYGDNYIVVRGGITEVVRGVVGSGNNGYKKRYYLDERILQGILPGDIWLKGKFIPAPAGWHDYRSDI